MQIQVERVEYKEVEAARDLYRQEANCQIVCDSLLSRRLADPYLGVLYAAVCAWACTDPLPRTSGRESGDEHRSPDEHARNADDAL
jgi:hypothetical protein